MWRIGEKILGRYTVEDLLAEGGQAELAKVFDHATQAVVVIRKLSASPTSPAYKKELARFQRAAKLRIGHPNVLDPLSYHVDREHHYMVLPFVDGLTLDVHVFRSGGKLSVNESVTIIQQVANGLNACHQCGVTHRDIKPANILIDHGGKIILIDFGLCGLQSEPTLTQGSNFQGSLNWAAPEQIDVPACGDPRIDLYAMGATFYFLLTGRMVVEGEEFAEILSSIKQWTPPSPKQLDPSIPEHVDQACMMLLRKRPEERFSTSKAFLEAISTEQDGVCTSCRNRTPVCVKFCPICGAYCARDRRIEAIHCLACGSPASEGTSCPACHRCFGAANHQFTFCAGSMTGMRFRIPEGIYLVGRDVLAPRDGHVSRRQLQIACVNGTVSVVDAQSSNGTFVDDVRVDELMELRPASTVRFAGNVAFYSQ